MALAALAGCGRAPPPSAPPTPVASDAAVPDLELAGGPPASAAPPAPPAVTPPGPEPLPTIPAAAVPAALTTAPARSDSTLSPLAGPLSEIPDPLQRFNRPMFRVGRTVDRIVASGASRLPSAKAPKAMRARIGNAVENLDEPRSFANQMLQRKPLKAIRTAARFVINSTLGVAGLFDVAKGMGLRRARADFGQTLASYGVGPGAYLYLPVRGPTNVRDVVAAVADAYFWPLHWVRLGWAARQAVVVATLELKPHDPRAPPAHRLAAAPLLDPYVAARRSYAVARQAEIRGPAPETPPQSRRPAETAGKAADVELASARAPGAGSP